MSYKVIELCLRFKGQKSRLEKVQSLDKPLGLGFCRQRKLCVQKQEDVRHGSEECEEELGNETE